MNGEPQKILVADDDPLNRQVLAELLKPEYTVLLAKDGAQALDRAARHAPDLILLDVMMPDLDGHEVLRRLRAAPRTAQTAVIFVSGLDRPEDEANGLRLGASDYIAKPFNATVVLARVALHLQLARQRRLLERLANLDGLTELANRRRFEEVYAAECRRAEHGGGPLSLALVDIDAFRQYNDHYGHLSGDRALRTLARALQACLRPSDLAARYGGEEFAILLPDTRAREAGAVVAAIFESVAALRLPHAASHVAANLTVSIGGATLGDDGPESPEALFSAADQALYRAKQGGRNRSLWREPV